MGKTLVPKNICSSFISLPLFYFNTLNVNEHFHVTNGQNTRDQITSDRRSKRAWSNCVMCIPFILSGSPNECWLHTSDPCVITTWRLGLWAPLVACNDLPCLKTLLRSNFCASTVSLRNRACRYASLVNANFSVNQMCPIICRWKLVKHRYCFGNNRRTKDNRKIRLCGLKACCVT